MLNVPNADEVAAQSVTHEQGLRGRSWSILQAQHDALTVGDFDYGNMGHHNGGMPLLIEKSRSTGGFCAAAVPSARHPWPVNTFEHRWSLAGHKRKVMSSDGGSSILAWKAQVAYALARSYGIEVVLEESAAGGPQGHGLAARSARSEGEDLIYLPVLGGIPCDVHQHFCAGVQTLGHCWTCCMAECSSESSRNSRRSC